MGTDTGIRTENKSVCLYSIKSNQIVKILLVGYVPNASDSARTQPGAPAPGREAGSHVGSIQAHPVTLHQQFCEWVWAFILRRATCWPVIFGENCPSL